MTDTEIQEEVKVEWTLTANDRCDSCGSQAYVHVLGADGDLLFCGHHYAKIVSDVVGNENLQKFAYQIIDERDRLIENKSQGDDY